MDIVKIRQAASKFLGASPLLHLINAFLVYAIGNLLFFPSESLFLVLQASIPFILALAVVLVLAVGSLTLDKRYRFFNTSTTFIVLISLYLFLAILKSPSLLINFGFFLLAFTIYSKLSWDRSKHRKILPLAILLTFPKVVHLVYQPTALDLGRFAILTENWNFNLIWTLLLAIIYALCAYILLSSLSSPFLEKVFQSKKIRHSLYAGVLFLGLVYIIYLSIVSAYKIKTFSVSTFDIGIFTQMFESMRRDFSQVTTLERDKFLSHFGVHISPIYYLLLPFYSLFPYGETLEILQVLVVFSGILPLHLILKKLDLPSISKPLFLLWFFVTPALTTSGSYHLHENCFLVPLLLWLVYATISQWKARLILITLLVLMVKEDAFIYVVSLGMFFLLQKRFMLPAGSKRLLFFSQVLFPLAYFAGCLLILNQFGEGAMVTRFENFLLADQQGLLRVLENIFLNPTYSFASLFSQAKVRYLFILLLSQAFLPLLQKEWANYLLFIPLIVINLLSDWIYQVDFGFQYHYGSNILVLFLSILALEALWRRFNKKDSLLAGKRILGLLGISIVLSTGTLYAFTHHWHQDAKRYFEDSQKYDDIHYTLSTIGRDKKVLAYHSYTVSLRSVKELYDIFYHNQKQFDDRIDTIVLPRSIMQAANSTEFEVVSTYIENGYQEGNQSTETVLILEKPDY